MEKEVWTITAPFYLRATPWLQPVTSSHCIFCVKWSLQIEAVTPLGFSPCLCTLRGLTPLCCFFHPQENPRHIIWIKQALFRVFILGPYYVWTRFFPAFEHGRPYCQLVLGHLLWIFSPGWSSHKLGSWLKYMECWGWWPVFIYLDGESFPYPCICIFDLCQLCAVFF